MTSSTPQQMIDARARFHAQVAALRELSDEEFAGLDPASLRPVLVPVRVRSAV